MNVFRTVLWIAIAVLGGFLAWSTVNWTIQGQNGGGSRLVGADIGGPFEAVRANGSKISRKDMIGRPHVVFFGFTHCPDVCPTTLYEAGQWLKELGGDGDNVDVYFVTVDPERDTPTILSEYLSAFDPRIAGVTGTPQQIAELVKAWRVFAKKEPTDDSYTMNHTATTFLMDAKGGFFGTIAYGEKSDVAVEKLKRLLKAS